MTESQKFQSKCQIDRHDGNAKFSEISALLRELFPNNEGGGSIRPTYTSARVKCPFVTADILADANKYREYACTSFGDRSDVLRKLQGGKGAKRQGFRSLEGARDQQGARSQKGTGTSSAPGMEIAPGTNWG